MILIPDNSTLREFIPNTMAPAIGETPLFEKISPFLSSAEKWFMDTFIDEKILKEIVDATEDHEDPLYFLPRRIVVLRAWINALPAIDVVVAPTGVGVTETTTLKPASKAKIDKLLEATWAELDFNIACLLPRLPMIPYWMATPPAFKLKETLFPNFIAVDALEIRDHKWEAWVSLSKRIKLIEKRIERDWISVPVMSRLRTYSLMGETDGVIGQSIELARLAVINELREGHPAIDILNDLTTLIRESTTVFPEWHTSATAELFRDRSFKNKKDSTGYFM